MIERYSFEPNFGEQLTAFLIENNAIEGIYNGDALDQAGYAWDYLFSYPKLTPEAMLGTHKILVAHQRLYPEHKGRWRNVNVYVGDWHAPAWQDVPGLIDDWLTKVDSVFAADLPKDTLESILQDLHIQYEQIHPFVDGNGRTGRMFWNFMRLQKGLPLKIIRERDRQEYYRLFH